MSRNGAAEPGMLANFGATQPVGRLVGKRQAPVSHPPLGDTVRELMMPAAATTGYRKPEPSTPPLKAGWSSKRHVEAIQPYTERVKRESQLEERRERQHAIRQEYIVTWDRRNNLNPVTGGKLDANRPASAAKPFGRKYIDIESSRAEANARDAERYAAASQARLARRQQLAPDTVATLLVFNPHEPLPKMTPLRAKRASAPCSLD